MIIPSRRDGVCLTAAAIATAGGVLAALHYNAAGLTLSHYDARGHLIVARRIFDSITPGWQQIGAVWLPLPHLLNAVPVQADAFYRSGASGVAISVIAFAMAATAVASIVLSITGSSLAALAGAAILVINPNVLYLQATPMTEPLLLGLTLSSVALLIAALHREGRDAAALVGTAFALACLTRYEAWPVTVVALALAAWARWRSGDTWSSAAGWAAAIGAYPAIAILGFLLFSRVVIGEWFVSSGFFVAENEALNDPVASVSQILWGARTLGGYLLAALAACGGAWLVVAAVRDRRHAAAAIALSLYAAAALPWWAFLHGHPYRIRYMVPLLAAEAVGAGVGIGALINRWRAAGSLAAVALVAAAAIERPPLDARAAMVVEAQWDRPNVAARRQVTDCLRAGYRGDTILASMGSLGHYMQEAAGAGFALRDFLHEGNGDIWLRALREPRPLVGWILIEEQAEGGDILAQTARRNPRFLNGFSRVCAGAGLALYQRQKRMLTVAR